MTQTLAALRHQLTHTVGHTSSMVHSRHSFSYYLTTSSFEWSDLQQSSQSKLAEFPLVATWAVDWGASLSATKHLEAAPSIRNSTTKIHVWADPPPCGPKKLSLTQKQRYKSHKMQSIVRPSQSVGLGRAARSSRAAVQSKSTLQRELHKCSKVEQKVRCSLHHSKSRWHRG